jgi:hypothetical protein
MAPPAFRRLAAAGLVLAGLVAAPASAQGAQVLLGVDGGGGKFAHLLSLDPATGAVTSEGGETGVALTGIAEDPTTGILYGVSSINDPLAPGFLFTIDQVTGAATQIGDLVPPATTIDFVSDITFTPDGTLYGWLESADDLVTINKTTGLATVVGNSAVPTNNVGLDSDSTGTLYLAVDTKAPLRTVSRATGAATPGPVMTGPISYVFGSIAFDPTDQLFGVQTNTGGEFKGNLLTIDRTSGALAPRPSSVPQLEGIEFVTSEARSISLTASPAKVKKNKKATLSGTVTAGGGCAAGRPVAIQQFVDNAFVDLGTVTTDGAGAFTSAQKLKTTTTFRATVSGPAVCDDAVSPTAKVKVKKKHGKD